MKQKPKEVTAVRLESPMLKKLKREAKKDDRSLLYNKKDYKLVLQE